ncbi:endonuclease domain-containing protein [Streptomyces sp. NPDC004230]
MLISPQLARDTLAELTRDSAVPVDPSVLVSVKSAFLDHGHIFIGDVALRGYKDKGRWKYDDRDIRRAGQILTALKLDHEDVLEVGAPSRSFFEDRVSSENWRRIDWRRSLNSWMYTAERRARHLDIYDQGDDFDPDLSPSRYSIGAHGLPGQLTQNELISFYGEAPLVGTRPLKLLAWSGTSWVLPRSYVDLLDRAQERDQALADKARICTGCQRRGTGCSWRTPTATGYVTLCPPCSGAAFQSYSGHLEGALYRSLRRTHRADGYLCSLCRERRASNWDHCHEHGFVRGPLCASCNTFEGKSASFLNRDGGTQHLLKCPACREQRTLPRSYHLDVVLLQLEETERHGRRCRRRPEAYRTKSSDGVHIITLNCYAHASRATWTRTVSAEEIAILVRAFVEASLSNHSTEVGDEMARP